MTCIRTRSLGVRFAATADGDELTWNHSADDAEPQRGTFRSPRLSQDSKPRRQGLELFRALPRNLRHALRALALPADLSGISQRLHLELDAPPGHPALAYPWESMLIDSAEDDGDPRYAFEPILEGHWALSIRSSAHRHEDPCRPHAHLTVAIALGDFRQDRPAAHALHDAAELVRRTLLAESGGGQDTASIRFAAHPEIASRILEVLDEATRGSFRARLTEVESKRRLLEFARSSAVFGFMGHSRRSSSEDRARTLDFGAFEIHAQELADCLCEPAGRETPGRTRLVVMGACHAGETLASTLLRSVPDVISTYGIVEPRTVASVMSAVLAHLAAGSSIPQSLSAARAECLAEIATTQLRLFRHWTTHRNHGPLLSPITAYATDVVDRLGSVKVYTAKGGSTQVPLETLHLALKADPTPLQERERGMRAWRLAVSEDLVLSKRMRAQGRFPDWAEFEDLPSEHRREQLAAAAKMLGIPGNDESAPVTLAEAYLANHSFVILGDPGSGKSTSLRWLAVTMAQAIAHGHEATSAIDGAPVMPARLPIWVECTEFEQFLRDCDDEQIEASIERFVRENWRTREAASHILDWVRNGKALFLFDGLDEVLANAGRRKIVESIHRFLGLDRLSSRRDFETVSGGHNVDMGNRLILSCRIVGDYTAEVDVELPRFTIEPISPSALPNFFAKWFQSVAGAAGSKAAEESAQALHRHLKEPGNKELLDAAGNPQIAAVLASVWHDEADAGRDESQRLERPIYLTFQRCAKHLLEGYIKQLGEEFPATARESETLDLLSSLAARMHEISGPLPQSELTRATESWRDQKSSWPALRFKIAATGLLPVRCGLLTTFSSDGVKFLHRRFQEFFVARWLIETGALAEGFARYRMDPAWRPVLTMGLEGLSVHPTRSEELLPLIDRWIDSEASNEQVLVPVGLQIVIRALPNIEGGRGVRRRIAERTVAALCEALCRQPVARTIPELRKTFEDLLRRLCEGGHRGEVIERFEAALAKPNNGPKLASSIAALGLSEQLGDALRNTLPFDEAPDFPVNHTLRSSEAEHTALPLSCDSDVPPTADDGDAARRLLLLTRGGLGELGTCEARRRYYELANFLSLENHQRDPFAPMLNGSWTHELRVRREDDGDSVYQIAVFLDTQGRRNWKETPEWSGARCYLASSRVGATRGDLDFRHAAELEVIATSASRRERQDTAEQCKNSPSFMSEVRQQYESLRDPVARTAPTLVEALEHLKERANAELMESATIACIRFADACCAPLDLTPLLDDQLPALFGEVAAQKLRGESDGARSYLEDMSDDPGQLLTATRAAGFAESRHSLISTAEWPVMTLPPVTRRAGDLPSDVLRSFDVIGWEFEGCREHALALAMKATDVDPDHRIETAALTLASRSDAPTGWKIALELAPEIADANDPARALEQAARGIGNPFVRARARLRVLAIEHAPDQRQSLWDAVLSDLDQLADPAMQQEALELAALTALRFLPETPVRPLVDAMVDAAHRVSCANDRSRALGRCAMFVDRNRRPALLAEAALAAGSIENRLERARMLAALRTPCCTYPPSREAWQRSNSTLADTWHGAIATGHLGSILRECDPLFDSAAPETAFQWRTVTSLGLLSDALRDVGEDDSHDALWVRAVAHPRETLREFQERQTERIRLSQVAALVIDELLEIDLETARELLTIASTPDPEVLPMLWRWTNHEDVSFASVAALLIAEQVGLTPTLVPLVTAFLDNRSTQIATIGSRHDLEARAGGAIHHPAEMVGGTLSARALTLDTLSELMKSRAKLNARGRLRIHWLFSSLIVFERGTMEQWIDRVEHGREQSLSSALSHLRFTSDAAFDYLLKRVEDAEIVSIDTATGLLRTWHSELDRRRNVPVARISACCVRTAGNLPLLRWNHAQLLAWLRDHAANEPGEIPDLSAALAPIETLVTGDQPDALTRAMDGYYTKTDGLTDARATDPVVSVHEIQTVLEATMKTLSRLHRVQDCAMAELIVTSMAVELAAAAAELQPIAFRVAFQGLELQKRFLDLLRWAASSMPSYPGRCGALILLGTLDHATRSNVEVLCDAMHDVDAVRDATLLAADMFTQADPDIFDELSTRIREGHPLEAYAAARVLGAVGRNQITPEDCARSVTLLLEAAALRTRNRHVFTNRLRVRIPDLPKLDELIYEIAQRTAGY